MNSAYPLHQGQDVCKLTNHGFVLNSIIHAVSMRTGSSTLNYLLGDHDHASRKRTHDSGSTAITTNSSGGKTAEISYMPWGGQRYAWGTTPTSYRFTGQREDSYINLYWYGSRWYDQSLGRFIQPDTIVPAQQGVQGHDRYAYVNNAPTRYTDPTGHKGWPPPQRKSIPIPLPDRTDLDRELQQYSSDDTPNLTQWLLTTMQANAASPTAHALAEANASGDKLNAWSAWAQAVETDAPWDFKFELNQSRTDTIALGDQTLPFDALANIHYGYVGRASGFSSVELQAGGGYAQITGGTSDMSFMNTYFDAPEDNRMIRVGIWLYDHYCDQSLTVAMLNEAFTAIPIQPIQNPYLPPRDPYLTFRGR